MPSEVSTAGANQNLARTVEELKRELSEGHRREAATAEVLKVISRSPKELRPVLDTMLQTAARLCEAELALFFKLQDGIYHLVGSNNAEAAHVKYLSEHPITLDRGSLVGRTALERHTVHLPDCLADPEYTRRDEQSVGKYRSMLGVPLLRDGMSIGVIGLQRTVVKPFTEKQIQLVETFADQAVIAIENARMFEEVQARQKELETRSTELSESLEYQTATTQVLDVISRTPNELQPVLDTIVATARKLCQAENAFVMRFDPSDGKYHAAAADSDWPEIIAYVKANPALPGRGSISGRVAIERRVVHVVDTMSDPELTYVDSAVEATRTRLGVPLLKDGAVIGVLVVNRRAMVPFSERQIALITTFANQAVIAINNVGLFDEVQARTRELTESLEYQTATSDVLGVINRSTFDLQAVLETLVKSAAQLCAADMVAIVRPRSEKYHHVAGYGFPPGFDEYLQTVPMTPGRGSLAGRVMLGGKSIQIADVLCDPDYTLNEVQKLGGFRTMLGVPLLRDGSTSGLIVLTRKSAQPFTPKQIELMETFADQAVIAIENTRLFEAVQARTGELDRSVEELRALGEVVKAVSSSLNLKTVLGTILAHACQMSESGGGALYVFDDATNEYVLEAGHSMNEEVITAVRAQRFGPDDPIIGRCAAQRSALEVPDIEKIFDYPLFEVLHRAGVRSLLVVPLLHRDNAIGVIILSRRRVGGFAPDMMTLLQTFAAQSAIAVHNARLFDEIAQKGRELEIASQHKSQFVANMSHELRTPLAAILGYAELMQEGFYGALSEKSTDALTRIRSNGKHLLGLINTVLDIAKIESGQFSLNLGEYALESVVETVRSATESLAETKKLALKTDVAKKLPIGVGDEQRLTQVLLNLVGNAIKFTDTGEVRITATAMNGHFTVAVTDTGPGIPAEELNRVFEQFHQIDNSNTKAKGGTGLGLAISKQIVEMHGGRIWVESTLGKGATFQMELPVRAAEAKGAA